MRVGPLQVAGCRLRALACLIVIAALLPPAAVGQKTGEMPAQLDGAGIEERLGEFVPGNLIFRNESGEEVKLGRYFDGERPVLLALVYHNCPMLCNMVLDGLTRTVSQMDWVPGDQYEVLAVSFNPRETPEIAREEKEMIVEMLGNPAAADGLHFLTGNDASIQALTQSVGFTYKWIEEKQQFAHPSGLVFLGGDRKISRYLYGIDYDPRDVRNALVEASNGRVGSTVDRVILYCFQYDPNENSYVPHALNLMKLGGVLTMVLLGGVLFVYWRRESRRSDEQLSA